MFNYDWFHGSAYQNQLDQARWRSAFTQFPDMNLDQATENSEFMEFKDTLQVRTLIYLRDGFSYEIKEIAAMETKSQLVFECEPVDPQYKVGSFVVSMPFDEIVRVEVFAVHPSVKPADFPQITGFRGGPEQAEHKPV